MQKIPDYVLKFPHFVPAIMYPNIKLLRKFISIDMLFDLLSVIKDRKEVSSQEEGMILLDLVSTMHWSRQYELPWSIEVAPISPDDIVLDAGCGYSSLKLVLAKRCKKVYGIDTDTKSLLEAQMMCDELGITNVELINADLVTYDTHIKFDKIYVISVIEHIQTDFIIKGFDNLIRLLKPGGKLIVTMDMANPKIDNFHVDEKFLFEILHHLNYTNDQLRHLKELSPIRTAKFKDKYGAETELLAVCFTYTKPC